MDRRRGQGGRVRVGLVGVCEGRADNAGGSLFTKHVESEMKEGGVSQTFFWAEGAMKSHR